MIGVFDSGVGGLTAVKELRKIAPDLDICFFADRKNTPYGTKTLKEVIGFSKANIQKLLAEGAERVLFACCTASTAYPYLTKEERQVSMPIIDLAARRALEISESGRIGVIATERTVKEEAFKKAIFKLSKKAEVFELEAQSFVALVEGGARDGKISDDEKNKIASVLSPLFDKKIDTLILGCTHFPHIESTVQKILGINTVNPSLEGALEIVKNANLSECGRTIHI